MSPVSETLLLWGALCVLRDTGRSTEDRMLALEYLHVRGYDPRTLDRGRTSGDRRKR